MRVSGCVAPLPCRPKLCRPIDSYVAPTFKLFLPNIEVQCHPNLTYNK